MSATSSDVAPIPPEAAGTRRPARGAPRRPARPDAGSSTRCRPAPQHALDRSRPQCAWTSPASGRRASRHALRQPWRVRCLIRAVRLGELHDDALCLPRMQERFHPLRLGVVVADDRIAARPRAFTRLVETRHRERHVVNPRASLGEEAMEEAVLARGLENFEVAAALIAPVPVAVVVGRRAKGRAAAELAGQDRLGVGQARHGDRDVVEQDRAHHAYDRTAVFFRSISAKSIEAPSPGRFIACTSPFRSGSMSSTSPYFCAPAGSSTSKNSQFLMAMITWRLATLLSELPPWCTSKFMWKPSARCAVFTSEVIPPFTATSPRR